jgi:zinc transporter ZupT
MRRKKDLGYIHIVGFFFENFVNGFILTILLISGVSYIIFIPFLLVTLAISLSLKHLNDRFSLGNSKYLLSLSVLIGTIVATVMQFSQKELYIMLAIMSGFLLYFVSRDMIPRGSYGKPLYFLLGVTLVLVLLQLTRIF